MAASSLDTVFLQNDQLRVACRPGLGAKLVSMLDRRTGREWLLPSQLPGGTYLQPAYGADFSRFDTSGWDECFPAVAAGPHPDAPITWPDHGELWSRPWRVEATPDSLTACVQGQAWPYTLTRRASLDGETLCLDYTLQNNAHRPFLHVWSAHPLLRVTPGMRIQLPGEIRDAYVDWSSDPARPAPGGWHAWPHWTPNVDLSTVQPTALGLAVKLYFRRLSEGRCGLVDPDSGQALILSWDLAAAPYLGLWLCYGGWPTDGRPGHLTVALEPCSGMPDRLTDAVQLGTSAVLPSGGTKSWSVRLRSQL